MEENNSRLNDYFLDEYVRPKKYGSKFWIRVTFILSLLVAIWVAKVSMFDVDITVNDLKSSLHFFNISSKWVQKEKIEDEGFKGIVLVPQVSFQLKNNGKVGLKNLYLLGVFRLLDNGKAIGEDNVMVLKDELLPGMSSERIQLKSGFGFRDVSKEAFKKNSQYWRSSQVEIYAKYGNSKMFLLKTFYISRSIEGIEIDVKII